MTAPVRFDPAAEVKLYRAAVSKIRRLDRNNTGGPATLKAISRHVETQRLAVFALANEGRGSLVTLLEAEELLVEQLADVDVNAADRPQLHRQLQATRAAIKVELDPNVISPGQAKDTLKAIKAQFQVYIDVDGEAYGPNLRENDHEDLPVGYWSIDWDGGPEMWTLTAGRGDVDDDVYDLGIQSGMNHRQATRAAQPVWMKIPHGVGLEAANGVILHLYPEA